MLSEATLSRERINTGCMNSEKEGEGSVRDTFFRLLHSQSEYLPPLCGSGHACTELLSAEMSRLNCHSFTAFCPGKHLREKNREKFLLRH